MGQLYCQAHFFGQEKALETIKEWIIEKAGAKKYLNDWTEFGRQMREQALNILYSSTLSLLEEEGPARIPSPYESILSTIELRRIGKETADLIKNYSVGILQSGSASWGGHISTRGQIREDPFGIEETKLREMKLISDVDMIVVIEQPQDAIVVVEKLINEGRLGKNELARIKKYVELAEANDIDMFSMRGYHGNVEQSYHIITKKVLNELTSPDRPPSKTIPVLRDFRPDKPGSFKKYGGYPILGTEGRQIALLKKEPTPVDETNLNLGYISESPAGGAVQIKVDGQETNDYALGVLTTQLMYLPDVLHDPEGFLRDQVDRVFLMIAPYLPHKSSFTVPRWERMPKSFKKRLLDRTYGT